MRLSRNFTLAEFIRSANADELGLDNTPGPDHLANLKVTALGLEMVRALFGGKPVTITSGYRNPQVNAAVGGSETSDHMTGYAADFRVKGLASREAVRRIINSPLLFDQLIFYPKGNRLHISFAPARRCEVLTKTPDGYAEGLI